MTAHAGRVHALDALRAAMMLLGLVLHSSTSYTQTPLGAAWPYQDAATSPLFDVVVFIIHLFRMPVFFVMAGFFAALLYFREGGAGFLANRTRRVLIPLACAWVVVFPLVRVGFVYAQAGGGSIGWPAAQAQLLSTPYAEPRLAHLWFLYDLFIFYLVAYVVAPLLLTAVPGLMRAIADRFAVLASGYTGVLMATALTTVTLLPMPKPALDTSTAFLPAPAVLAAYGVFFTFGWLLFTRRHIVSEFARRPFILVGLAVLASVAYLAAAIPYFPIPERAPLHAYALAALAVWLWTYAVIGLFLRFAAEPRPLQRYISDGSYWIYLIHLPFTIWMPGLLAPLALPAVVKFAIVVSTTAVVTVATYHFFVRSTLIGAALNGRRFPRALPPVPENVDGRVPVTSA